MRAFDAGIVELLNGECNSGAIHFVGLGQHDFQMSFGKIRKLQSTYKMGFYLGGKFEFWDDGPLDIPVWTLVGQIPSSVELTDPLILRLNFVSGDYVEFHSDVGQYESMVLELLGQGDAIAMEVF